MICVAKRSFRFQKIGAGGHLRLGQGDAAFVLHAILTRGPVRLRWAPQPHQAAIIRDNHSLMTAQELHPERTEFSTWAKGQPHLVH